MRNFVWCRQEVAENCERKEDHSHVIITAPGNRRIIPHCRQVTLRLFFLDLDPEAIRRTEAFKGNPTRGRELIAQCFTEEHATHIVKFIMMTKPSETVIVNCEAGISRSAGIVLAFRRFQEQDTDDVFAKAHPNIHVASTLGRKLGVGPFQEPKYEGIVDPFSEAER